MPSVEPVDPGTQPDPLARPMVDFLFPGILLAALTAIFFFLPIDLTVEEWFYEESRGGESHGGWFLKDAAPLVTIYDKGLIPGLVVALGSIATFLMGFWVVSFRRYRKMAIYLLLVMVIAPGLLVNALMKEGWGRPRPRQVKNFGGKEVYERVWEYDGRSYGKSFPSGHAAMGFYFFGLYFLMRREGRWAVALWLGVALGLGGLLGITRMAQGGHFPSDVVWSAAVCYFVAAALYYALGLHRGLWYTGGRISKMAIAGCFVALLGIAAIGLGTPYYEEKNHSVPVAELVGVDRVRVKLELPRANLRISPGDGLVVKAEAEGFGSPGSRLEDQFKADLVDGRYVVKLRQKKSGFFATVEQPMTIVVPRGMEIDGELVMARGVVNLELGERGGWELELGDVDLKVVVPDGLEVKVELDVPDGVNGKNEVADLEWDADKKRYKRGENPTMKVRIKITGSGRIDFFPRTSGGD